MQGQADEDTLVDEGGTFQQTGEQLSQSSRVDMSGPVTQFEASKQQ